MLRAKLVVLAVVAYEVFVRTGVRVDAPMFSIVPDGRIGINSAAVRIMVKAGIKAVFLLWDKANHKIAAKAAPKSDKNAYAVSITTNHSGNIRAKKFISHIGWNAPTRETLPATWNEKEKMFEVTLPERHLGLAGGTGGKKLSDDIEQVRREEERRGRRPVDSVTLEERRRFKDALQQIVNHGTVDDLKEAMREFGILPDSGQWAEVLRIWSDEREPR